MRFFHDFAAAWKLDWVSPSEGWQFVNTAGNRARMDDVAICAPQGHTPMGITGEYDHPEENEDI
jgi:hypothetical protein